MTLHDIVSWIRRSAKWILIGIGGLIGLLFLFNIARSLFFSIFPQKEVPPAAEFGKLAPIPFPQLQTKNTYTYTLNTISGGLPVFDDRMNIYPIQQPVLGLLSLASAKNIVNKTEFASEPLMASDTLYQWKIPTPPIKTLSYDILTRDFYLVSDYLNYPQFYNSSATISPDESIKQAREFFGKIQADLSDIDDSLTKTTLYKAANGNIEEASSLSSANVIEIDFFQKAIDDIPIFYPSPPNSLIHATISHGLTQRTETVATVVTAYYSHKSIDTTRVGTYAIKTSQEAYDELQLKKAYIARSPINTNVVIKDIQLGYYMSDQTQYHLMPVYKFRGEGGFIAYVSAVRDEWINK